MTLPKEIYRFVEYELYHYDIYREELKLERERIMDVGYSKIAGIKVMGGQLAKPTEQKALKLSDSMTILNLEKTIRAIESSLTTEIHETLFNEVYRKNRRDLYGILGDLSLTKSTYYRYKNGIVLKTAQELGLIKPGCFWKA